MFKIEFDTTNAAFEERLLGPHIANILFKLGKYLEEITRTETVNKASIVCLEPYIDGGIIKDINGNTIGNWTLVHHD